MKLSFIFIISILTFSAVFTENCFSQDPDTLGIKAGFYYENQEFKLAIPAFTSKIINNPNDFGSIQKRGNCFFETGNYAKAIQDYLSALKIKTNSDLYFSLGDAYERSEKIDSAIYWFNRFNSTEPKLSNGFSRLCIIYMYSHPEWPDTAIYFASMAVKKDAVNTKNLHLLAMAYYSAGQYKSALGTSLSGLAIDSSNSDLNQAAGISSFFLKDYISSIKFFDCAFRNNPADFTLQDYKIQSMLLQNTDPGQISFLPGKRIFFTRISSENLKSAEELILINPGNYSYRKLLQKIRSSPFTMSLDEYFMFYLGSSLQSGYSPFHKSIYKKNNEKDLNSSLEILEDMVFKNPSDFPLYLELSEIYGELGNKEKYFENRFRYFGFIESIKATGDGLLPETAFIINDMSHENSIMLSLGYRPKSQKLIKQKKHSFDLITVTDEINTDINIYFNVDKPLDSLPNKRIK